MGYKKESAKNVAGKPHHPFVAFLVCLVLGTLPVGGCISIIAFPEAFAVPILVIAIVAILTGSGWIVLNFREAARWFWQRMR